MKVEHVPAYAEIIFKQESREAKKSEFCDWCQGGASDLVYNLDDMEWG